MKKLSTAILIILAFNVYVYSDKYINLGISIPIGPPCEPKPITEGAPHEEINHHSIVNPKS